MCQAIPSRSGRHRGFRTGLALACLTSLWLLGSAGCAAEWQWSVEVNALTIGNSTSHPRAFLWIPPDCRRVRALVFGQNNMIEEGILEHPEFRQALAKLGMAELYVAPTFDTWQDATTNNAVNTKFDALLKALAGESGYEELESGPIIPMGHSAMASFPWNFAAWNRERTLAILSLKGDAPQTTLTGNGRPNAVWGKRNIDGIPGVMVMDEYEWWEDRLAPLFQFQRANPGAPVAMLAEPGRGHFDFSDDLVHYLVLFIRKAAEWRLPANSPWAGPVQLRPVDAREGWLVDRWRKDEKPRAKAAKVKNFLGNPAEAFWAFDQEMAQLVEEFNGRHRNKQPQMLGFVQEGRVVEQTPNTHEQVRLKLPLLDDSLTFQLSGAFLGAVATGDNPVRWTGRTNGAPLGHAGGGGPVTLSRISGPAVQLAADTFAIRFNRSALPADRRAGDIWLLAEHPGDAQYKSAVQQALLKIPIRLTVGAPQRVTFPQIPDVPAGTKTLKLEAASDARAPVYFYVREGPAEIEGDTLRFTGIPPRATFPLKVTVVAWQWGRTTEPKLQSAEPVIRTFNIIKP